MNKSSEQTQCYAMQLQIDTFLDGELEGDQQAAFVGHVAECSGCAHELRYAQNLYESVLDLPEFDCSDVLIDNLLAISTQRATQRVEDSEDASAETTRLPLRAGLFAQLDQFFRERLPLTIGFAAVSTLVIAVAIVMAPRGDNLPQSVVADVSSNSIAEMSPVTPVAFDAEQVRMALEELNTAIDYLNRASQQTETMIGERFVVLPLQQSVNNSLRRASFSGNEERQAGPI
ncbi:MAG: zf-HC2 domain-containing protein [Pseudomonadales bacterium]|nr:zf-HC2 domain-containing protein [Pseudomonadales bacterium]